MEFWVVDDTVVVVIAHLSIPFRLPSPTSQLSHAQRTPGIHLLTQPSWSSFYRSINHRLSAGSKKHVAGHLRQVKMAGEIAVESSIFLSSSSIILLRRFSLCGFRYSCSLLSNRPVLYRWVHDARVIIGQHPGEPRGRNGSQCGVSCRHRRDRR